MLSRTMVTFNLRLTASNREIPGTTVTSKKQEIREEKYLSEEEEVPFLIPLGIETHST